MQACGQTALCMGLADFSTSAMTIAQRTHREWGAPKYTGLPLSHEHRLTAQWILVKVGFGGSKNMPLSTVFLSGHHFPILSAVFRQAGSDCEDMLESTTTFPLGSWIVLNPKELWLRRSILMTSVQTKVSSWCHTLNNQVTATANWCCYCWKRELHPKMTSKELASLSAGPKNWDSMFPPKCSTIVSSRPSNCIKVIMRSKGGWSARPLSVQVSYVFSYPLI